MKRAEGREGLCFINKYGESFIIIEYINNEKVKIRFKNNYEKWVHWRNIIAKKVISPYAKTVYKNGYLGDGEYNHKNCKKEYEHWKGMIRRCYDINTINKYPTYKGCYVEDYLLNFQNFVKWVRSKNFNLDKEVELDKDILEKGNKKYDRCHIIFIPKRINSLLLNCTSKRGEFPIGVYYHKMTNKLQVTCCIIDEKGCLKKHYLGLFPLNRPFQAFTVYKNFKENYIKQVADEYYLKGLISKELYEALYKYEVEIND